MGVTFRHRGDFKNLEKFLKNYNPVKITHILEKYGQLGVNALMNVTPVDTGVTANSWTYSVSTDRRGYSILWTNTNITSNGTPIIILLIYGHGTRQGGYVRGRDFITPTTQPIFDLIADEVWNEVVRM